MDNQGWLLAGVIVTGIFQIVQAYFKDQRDVRDRKNERDWLKEDNETKAKAIQDETRRTADDLAKITEAAALRQLELSKKNTEQLTAHLEKSEVLMKSTFEEANGAKLAIAEVVKTFTAQSDKRDDKQGEVLIDIKKTGEDTNIKLATVIPAITSALPVIAGAPDVIKTIKAVVEDTNVKVTEGLPVAQKEVEK